MQPSGKTLLKWLINMPPVVAEAFITRSIDRLFFLVGNHAAYRNTLLLKRCGRALAISIFIS